METTPDPHEAFQQSVQNRKKILDQRNQEDNETAARITSENEARLLARSNFEGGNGSGKRRAFC